MQPKFRVKGVGLEGASFDPLPAAVHAPGPIVDILQIQDIRCH